MQLGTGAPNETRQTRIFVWIVTLIIAGVAFGFALTASHRWTEPPRISILALSSLLPLSIVIYFYVEVASEILNRLSVQVRFQ